MNELYSSHNTEPLVSFIITSYNIPSHMIKECIGSLLKLSLSNEEREIILVDDGSDISVINEITELRDELVYVRQRNKGLSVARNTGLRYASGRYIQFVDGDDFIILAPYEHCLDIARYQTPDMIMFKMTSTPDVDVPFSYSEPVSGSNYMKNNNLVASVCGFLFRRNILGDLRFRPGIVHEDEDFTPQLLLRAENADLKDRYARANADFENIKKRMQREKEQMIAFANEGFARDLLDVVDTLEAALNVEASDELSTKIKEGVKNTLDLLLKKLKNHGVELIEAKEGDEFNPELHEAMFYAENENFKANELTQILQKGYKLRDRILRHTKVSVAK